MKQILFSALLLFSVSNGFSQIITPGKYDEEYIRVLNLKNYSEVSPIGIFPSITNLHTQGDSISWNIWNDYYKIDDYSEKSLQFSKVSMLSAVNYTMPWSYNDGPIWRGKGNNLAITAGINYVSENFIIRFNPILNYSENRPFRIPETEWEKSEFSYPLAYRLDYVQRFGNGSFTKLYPGQSEVRFVLNNWTIGAGSQNISWGPSYRNPILLSKQAAGIPHIDIGTFVPRVTKIGTFEGKSYWGILSESQFFDENPDNNRNLFGGLVLGYRPSFLKSLSVGISRSFYRQLEGIKISDLFAQFVTFNRDFDEEIRPGIFTNDLYDQMLSLYATWTFEEEGFEVYLEFAKNDFPGNFLEFVRYPDRARAYTLGFNKLVDVGAESILKFGYEGTVLGSNQVKSVTGSGNPIYYIHTVNELGYTHDGQLLGAGIGPASNSNWLGFTLYTPSSQFGLEAERIRFNDDYLVSTFSGQNPAPVEYQLNYIANAVHHLNQFSFQGKLIYSRHSNWYTDDDRGGETLNFQINLDYRF